MKNLNINILNKYDKIVFGPFIGEFGWEIMRWSGFVKWYKNSNSNKSIVAATRTTSKDLYYDYVDDIFTFNIQDDYIKCKPDMYGNHNFHNDRYQLIINNIKSKFPDYYIVEPKIGKGCRNYISKSNMIFDFSPHIDNKKIVSNIISSHLNKKVLVISSRFRKDSGIIRNWSEDNWLKLFNMINNKNEYLVFITGVGNSYIKAPKNYKSFINIEDIVTSNNSSVIGLTIECIKKSFVTVGSQSAIPLLSNFLNVPTIIWGHEKQRHQVNENYNNTKCIFIDDMKYICDPLIIFNQIEKLVGMSNV